MPYHKGKVMREGAADAQLVCCLSAGKELVLNTIYLDFFYARNRGGTSLIFSILFCEKA